MIQRHLGSSPEHPGGHFEASKSPLAAFHETPDFAQPGRLLAPRGVFRAHGSSPLGPLGIYFLNGAKPSPPELFLRIDGGMNIPILTHVQEGLPEGRF